MNDFHGSSTEAAFQQSPAANPTQTHPLSPPGVVEVVVANRLEEDKALTDAIEQVLEAAREHGTGVLVTRIGTGRFIVRAHSAVPEGLVRQRPAHLGQHSELSRCPLG